MESFTSASFCFFKQKKESVKKTQDEEIKQIDEERTKQIYKNWKEDSEWQASCKYPEASMTSHAKPVCALNKTSNLRSTSSGC